MQIGQHEQAEKEVDPRATASEEFIKRHYSTSLDDRERYEGFEFDVDGPVRLEESLSQLYAGELHITNFTTTPGVKEGELKYHFRLGQTDFHLSGEAVEAVNIIQQELQEKSSQ